MPSQYSQQQLHAQSLSDPASFWQPTVDSISWSKPPTSILHTSKNGEKWQWFPDGEMNMCYEILDANVKRGLGDVDAIIWDSPVTHSKERITYSDLSRRVQLFAGVLKSLGVKKGQLLRRSRDSY